jgi:TonB family protein
MRAWSLAGACLLASVHGLAAANDVSYLSDPIPGGMQKVSMARSAKEYRMDAARHVYAAYAPRIYKGRLPPLIHGVVVVETAVDATGRTRDVTLIRGPKHAPDVSAAVVEMIRRASPMPAPSRMTGGTRFIEIWLVHKNGRFQLDALTEGQD